MSYKYAVEDFARVIGEIIPMVEEHYAEVVPTALLSDEIILAPDWATMLQLSAARRLGLFTVRESENNELLGYAVFIVHSDLHRKLKDGSPLFVAHDDAYFIKKKARGPRVAINLFALAESTLLAAGVRRLSIHTKGHSKSGRLFAAMGYTQNDVMYTKNLVQPAVEDAPAETVAQAPKAA